ncbi:MAG TPA: hypothetical protein VMF69_21645 [Gemmataceae bacterium]|nr:hypothetical protein [Gemmataceae bacterium]
MVAAEEGIDFVLLIPPLMTRQELGRGCEQQRMPGCLPVQETEPAALKK